MLKPCNHTWYDVQIIIFSDLAYSWLKACSESAEVTFRKQKCFKSVDGSRIRGFPNTYSAAMSSWILSRSNFGTCCIVNIHYPSTDTIIHLLCVIIYSTWRRHLNNRYWRKKTLQCSTKWQDLYKNSVSILSVGPSLAHTCVCDYKRIQSIP